MKTLIMLIALFLLTGTGAFASIHPKSNRNISNNRVSLVPLKHSRGFAIMVDKNMPGNAVVFICDINGDCIFKHKLQNGLSNETKYLTTQLDAGQYTVEVYSKDLDVKTKFYIYNNGSRRIEDIN